MANLAAEADLGLIEALELSWERLQMMAKAHRRKNARLILKLGQLITAGQGSKESWRSKQQEIIGEINE